MSYRERISADLSASLQERHYESPADRVLAFSYAPERASTALWRLKYRKDMSSYRTCSSLLTQRLRLRTRLSRKLVHLALFEWLNPHCSYCNGAKEMIVRKRRIICNKCKGLGIQRYSDMKRSEVSGIEMQDIRKGGRVLARIHDEIDKLDRAVNGVMTVKLQC